MSAPPTRTLTSPARVEILGCPIDRVDMARAVDTCLAAVRTGTFVQHMAINAAKLVAMQNDDALREAIRDCGLITADGQAVVWASRLLGDPLPERVAGIDLMHHLIAHAAREGRSIYVLGARQEVLEAAVAKLRARYVDLRVAGYHHGYFGDDGAEVAAKIRDARPDILLVAISSPQKEYFIARHRDTMGVPFAMGVGGAIDIVAGATRRAPVWMQRHGLEWLFRLLQEPRRMFMRYLVGNFRFVALVLRGMSQARVVRARKR